MKYSKVLSLCLDRMNKWQYQTVPAFTYITFSNVYLEENNCHSLHYKSGKERHLAWIKSLPIYRIYDNY